MKFLTLLLLVAACALSQAFAPPRVPTSTVVGRRQPTKIHINIGDQERETITRDSEPEDFFAT